MDARAERFSDRTARSPLPVRRPALEQFQHVFLFAKAFSAKVGASFAINHSWLGRWFSANPHRWATALRDCDNIAPAFSITLPIARRIATSSRNQRAVVPNPISRAFSCAIESGHETILDSRFAIPNRGCRACAWVVVRSQNPICTLRTARDRTGSICDSTNPLGRL